DMIDGKLGILHLGFLKANDVGGVSGDNLFKLMRSCPYPIDIKRYDFHFWSLSTTWWTAVPVSRIWSARIMLASFSRGSSSRGMSSSETSSATSSSSGSFRSSPSFQAEMVG